MAGILVVVFDDERKAYEGAAALMQLQREGLLSVYECAMIMKDTEDSVSLEQIDGQEWAGPVAGSTVGDLARGLEGLKDVAIDARSGLVRGALYHIDGARMGGDLLDEVSKSLTPNRVAVVAEVEEEWTTPVDNRMEALGGTVLRPFLWATMGTVRAEEIAAMKADLKIIKGEISEVEADGRAMLQERADQLQAKVDAQLRHVKEQREGLEARRKARRDILKKKRRGRLPGSPGSRVHPALKQMDPTGQPHSQAT